KRLDITCLHPDPNGSFNRFLACCVRRRWQIDLKEIGRNVLPWSLRDEAVLDKKEADIGLAGAPEDQPIHIDVEEYIIADVVRLGEEREDGGGVETCPSNTSEDGEIVPIDPEHVENHVRHPAVGERDFTADGLRRKVEGLQGYIGVTVVGRLCRLAHDGSDLSRRHAEMEPTCANRHEVHAWTRRHPGLRRY